MNLYRSLLRPILFRLDAETAHHLAINVCATPGIHRLAAAVYGGAASTDGGIDDPRLSVSIGELTFPNPVGLAAGWDKNAQCMRCLESLGFGAIEVGSVSAKASIGNPKPRLFRLPTDDAIVVNYGLPNDGAEQIARRLERHRPRVPLGINVVKTNDALSPPAAADAIYDDYFDSISRLHRYASYLVLNLSCPNSEGDADFFASPGSASPLLERLAELDLRMPVFFKVAPDPEPRSIERWIEEAQSHSFVTGFVFNLPSGKPATLRLHRAAAEYDHLPGAVAGRPVAELLDRCLHEMYQRMPRDRFTLIGGGGIFSADDAYRKIRLGASLIQIYTALVYEGPGVIARINEGLVANLRRDGFKSVSQAVGVDSRTE